eukprot:TRINITY_DN36781_c0_g1_i1.p1 TRINITY_DN36781_c0_g1~~TRINITY_DN36781_c0_g1_i1.p1  ORF type:complete len:344 (+),score=90.85 TRINITY_DN36781_c0_g1_i1:58-1089(+)
MTADTPEAPPAKAPTKKGEKKKKKKKAEDEGFLEASQEVDNFDYNKKPPSDMDMAKMTNEQLVDELINNRKRADHWSKEATKKKRDFNEAKSGAIAARKRRAEIKAKIDELNIEKQYLEVEAQVVQKNQEIKLKREEDDFCADILELERHLDNNEVVWYNQACEMRDDDVVNTNEHLLKEERTHLEIEEIRRKLAVELQRLKMLKHAHVRRMKLYDFQEHHLKDLQQQCETRGITPAYLSNRRSMQIEDPASLRPPIALGGASVASSDKILPSRGAGSPGSPRKSRRSSPKTKRTAGHDIVMDLHKQVFEDNNKFANKSKSKPSSSPNYKSGRPKDPLRFLFK